MILTLLQAAFAAGGSADVELVPATAVESVPGLPDAPRAPAGSIALTLGGHYSSNPLVTSSFGTEQALVGSRFTGWVGARFHLLPRLAVDASVPVVRQWGGEVASSDADGGALGDPRLNVIGTLAKGERGDLWVGVGVALPVGAKEMWVGEEGVRGGVSAGGAYGGRLRLNAGVGVEARDAASADAVLALGTEGWFRGGLSYRVGPVDFGPHLVARTGSRGVLQSSPTLGVEPGFGVAIHPTDSLRIAAQGGIGVTDGYGAPDARARVVLTWRRDAAPKPPPPVERESFDLDISDRPPPVPVFEPEPPPPPAPRPPLPVIGEVVTFDLDAATLDAADIAAIDAVAVKLLITPTIDHVVIVGHASFEGDFRYNFELADRRARAVFEALVSKGIHPYRLSWRAMGEVEPAGGALPADRRVTFTVVSVADAPPTLPTVPRPWDGR